MPLEVVRCVSHVVCDNCGTKLSTIAFVGPHADLEDYCFPDLNELSDCLNNVDWWLTCEPTTYEQYKKGRKDHNYQALFVKPRYYCSSCQQAARDADAERMKEFGEKYEKEKCTTTLSDFTGR